MIKDKEKYIDQKVEKLKKICSQQGLRVTQQRIEIFKAVASSCEHPDAETIFQQVKEQMPNVSFDTVYRTLASLEELNMIFRVDNQLPKARFDADLRTHYHFLCTRCNEVYDIFPQDNEIIKIPESFSRYGEIKDYNLQIRGICKKCLDNKNENKEKK